MDNKYHSNIFEDYLEEIKSTTSTLRSKSCHSEECVTSKIHSNPLKFMKYKSSSGYNPQQFSGELLKQLKEHERFISQRRKHASGSSIPKNNNRIVKMKDPSYSVTEFGIQLNNYPERKCSSIRCNQTSRIKASQELFNPSLEMNTRYNSQFSTLGKSLIESIKCKVFGKQKNIKYMSGDSDDWGYDENGSEVIVVKFPKETRHAMNKLVMEQRSRACPCSESSEKLNKIIEDNKTTSKKPSKQVIKSNKTVAFIPCPLNLLCDKGIHLGNCEDAAMKKMANPSLCEKNCSCRLMSKSEPEKATIDRNDGRIKIEENAVGITKTYLSNENIGRDRIDENYPKLGRMSRIFEKLRRSNFEEKSISSTEEEEESGSIDLTNVSESSLSRVANSSSVVSSTETFLKLMEPQLSREFKYPMKISPRASVSSIMNGLNGHTNGDLNGCGDIITQNQQKGCWTIGLINSKYRYLTAETFGFKINANGTSLKKKQIWTLEPENANNGDSLIYLRSHLDKYLAVDSFGNVTCESDEKDPGCQFQISVAEDGSGRWALKNVVRGYFLGSTLDKLTCTAKVPGDAEFWHVHLAARPQVNLRSIGRKRFAHLSENLDEIHVDANIPWGEDTLFTLEFRLDESGKYAIHTCNNKYLSMGGKLVDTCNKDCLFSAEYHSGQLALRDRTGAYLSPIGSKAVLKTRSNSVTKDELFSLEDSLPQASFVASLNSRFVSVKQGVDVTANQDEISDHETFQLEFDWSTKRWYIRTMQDRYWTLETGGGIQACGDKRSSNALFDLVWQNDGSLAFRANNGRYVITKRSGHLYATSDNIDDNCKYFFYLINRPILVLKCEQGFVGYKSGTNPKLECNKATYECIQVERGEKGVVYFKGQNGKYWHADSEGVNVDSDAQEGFYLELREPTRLCIKSLKGNYLAASKNGLFRLGDTSIENATQWEY